MRQLSLIANGFRNLRIQKQEKYHLRKDGDGEDGGERGGDGEGLRDGEGSGDSGSANYRFLVSYTVGDPHNTWEIEKSPAPESDSINTICGGECVDVCDLREKGYNANNPIDCPSVNSINISSPCIKGPDDSIMDWSSFSITKNSSPNWQSIQLGSLATWYYSDDGYFFDRWNNNGDSGSPPTSCFCTAPEALSTSSRGIIFYDKKVPTEKTFRDQYYYYDNGSPISFYISFDGTSVNIFSSNGNVSVTDMTDLPKLIQFGDYNIELRQTSSPSSSSSSSSSLSSSSSSSISYISYTVTKAEAE